MRRRVAVHDVVALLNEVAFGHWDVLALRHHVFDLHVRIFGGLNRDTALVLVVLTKAHIAVDFRDDRMVFGATCLKEFRNPRQTTGDVFRFGTFTRDTCDNVTGFDLGPVFHRQDRIHRHRIGHWVTCIVAHRLTIAANQDHLRLQLIAFRRCTPVDHDLLGHAGGIIGFVLDGDTRYQIDKLRQTGFFCDDRQCVGIPLKQLVATCNRLPVFDKQLGAVTHLVAGAFFTVVTRDDQLHVAAHHHDLAIGVLKGLCVFKHNLALVRGLKEGLLTTLRNATNVERPHRQLCTGFTDGLRGNDANSLTLVHQRTTCEVTTVAHRTNAFFGVTGQRRADPCRLHAGLFDCVCHAFVDNSLGFDQNIIRAGLEDIIRSYTTQQTLRQRGNNLTIIHGRNGCDRRFCPTVMHTHDAVLCHVNQATGQVTGVRRFQSRV